MKKQLPKILVVCGPTATGKSDLAVALAVAFDGEVISADSRQVYKGLNIGAGKITEAEMKGVPHHLLDVIDPKKTYTVEKFRIDGKKAIDDILRRDKLPIICGGTGFYIDALVSGEEFPAVSPDPKLRATLAKKTPETLMKIIAKLDPKRAKALDPHNKVRIIRAIEIVKSLGKVPKVKRKTRYETLYIGLTTEKETLRKRIHDRLLKRVDAGMIQEVKKLRANGVSWKRLHSLGLEYRYVALLLQKKISKEEMLEKLENEIVHFAKRQMTWFKRNKDIEWISPGKTEKSIRMAKQFLSK
jgi:tRNA dimethylallyltransferase